ncbi:MULTISPECIES: sensor histidine kinase [unclassified Massilia]|uniref:sensor histidine kinase n=1 Tax=unclassified Massilia TaxID=2609279 RepID=UPI001594C4C1|nr:MULTISPECIES: response regulator [unclassified Massilia]NVE01452.1 response regulator [Massilia sp. BJB1822]UTY56064.1 response regulator [Massilia sp. erpn]
MSERFNVLVVDDNPANRLTLRALLARLRGCEVMEAESGEATLLLTLEQDCHLILLDVHMPGMDGFETARHLQMTERTRNIPIVFITAVFMSDEFIGRGYALGAVDYLVKPLDDNLLLNRVRQYQYLHEREMALERRTRDLLAANNQLQEALNRLHLAQDKLVQSEKLAALGAIVAAVAHELNTPIGNCMTVASALEDQVGDFEKVLAQGPALKRSQLSDYLSNCHTALQLMMRGLHRAADLVANFKQVAVDHTSSQRRSFELRETIGGVVALMKTSLRKSPYQIELAIPEGLHMDSYPGPLDQIISNLINNSVLHGFQGRDHGQMRLQASLEGASHVRLHYSDDGCGMSEEVRAHVFDPFFTTRLGKGGSGLGMNICYNLVTGLLGGSIEARATPEGGSAFLIVLPLVAPPSS